VNPYDAPTTDSSTAADLPHRRSFPRSAVVAIAISLVAPILTCLPVIDSLIGVENLKRHYWFTDGLVISGVLNAVVFAAFLHPAVRRFATGYSIFAAIAIPFLAFAGYGYWMVALMGV
jgi:hypothetical protein